MQPCQSTDVCILRENPANKALFRDGQPQLMCNDRLHGCQEKHLAAEQDSINAKMNSLVKGIRCKLGYYKEDVPKEIPGMLYNEFRKRLVAGKLQPAWLRVDVSQPAEVRGFFESRLTYAASAVLSQLSRETAIEESIVSDEVCAPPAAEHDVYNPEVAVIDRITLERYKSIYIRALCIMAERAKLEYLSLVVSSLRMRAYLAHMLSYHYDPENDGAVHIAIYARRLELEGNVLTTVETNSCDLVAQLLSEYLRLDPALTAAQVLELRRTALRHLNEIIVELLVRERRGESVD